MMQEKKIENTLLTKKESKMQEKKIENRLLTKKKRKENTLSTKKK